ncbi:MAG: DinB family protein [Saprospiraceae bacterium]
MTNQLFVKMALDSWNSKINDTNRVLGKITDERLAEEIAPSRNRGIYVLGHLVSVHDRMLPLLNLGDQMYNDLDEIFLTNPDRSKPHSYSAGELRQRWNEVNTKLTEKFNSLTEDEWFQKHNAVSAEDFEKEPHRNRLNVLLSRTNHLSYHHGQLVLMKE